MVRVNSVWCLADSINQFIICSVYQLLIPRFSGLVPRVCFLFCLWCRLVSQYNPILRFSCNKKVSKDQNTCQWRQFCYGWTLNRVQVCLFTFMLYFHIHHLTWLHVCGENTEDLVCERILNIKYKDENFVALSSRDTTVPFDYPASHLHLCIFWVHFNINGIQFNGLHKTAK